MPEEPGAFYTIADRLFEGLPIEKAEEVCTRTVAGRLYYSAYLATRQSLRQVSGNPEYIINHTALVQFLRTFPKDTWINEYGERLEDLRSLRSDSDYKLHLSISRPDASAKRRDAKWIVDNQAELRRRLSGAKFPPSRQDQG